MKLFALVMILPISVFAQSLQLFGVTNEGLVVNVDVNPESFGVVTQESGKLKLVSKAKPVARVYHRILAVDTADETGRTFKLPEPGQNVVVNRYGHEVLPGVDYEIVDSTTIRFHPMHAGAGARVWAHYDPVSTEVAAVPMSGQHITQLPLQAIQVSGKAEPVTRLRPWQVREWGVAKICSDCQLNPSGPLCRWMVCRDEYLSFVQHVEGTSE